jgi:hypothetical protein
LISLGGIVAVCSTPLAADRRSVAAVFPPWWSAARAFEAAGSAGEIARTGAYSSILIVHSTQPALAARLRKAGAFLVLDPMRLARCMQPTATGTLDD